MNLDVTPSRIFAFSSAWALSKADAPFWFAVAIGCSKTFE